MNEVQKKGASINDPITISDFNRITASIIKSEPRLQDVWLIGEISNLKLSNAGHYYFTLKDAESEISCTMFRGAAARLKEPLKDKSKVLAFGSANIYHPQGRYQFNVIDIRDQGIGDLHALFQELKEKLEREGLFDSSHKKPLPRYPDKIGVVTSPTGSVIRDIINVARRRYPCEIILSPAQVQGKEAAASIVKAISLLERFGVDLIIVGRGGGSLEDLWPFNEELVARAIYACPIPVISAVGHETDFSISDFVADRRAETPSAAAEMALPDLNKERQNLKNIFERGEKALKNKLLHIQNLFRSLDVRLRPERALERVEQSMQGLDVFEDKMRNSLERKLEKHLSTLNKWDYTLSPRSIIEKINSLYRLCKDVSHRADMLMMMVLDTAGARIASLEGRMEALNPYRVLDRGYAIVMDTEGRPITSVSRLNTGDIIWTRLHDGSLLSEIKEKEEII
ncbi:MAG: exodeoxyribonuclease large subunit [Candidatus Methanomethylophilaceae archaeon]|nr:exodeoxyribonuclease large subunit [Candidatus Methanomethylophilaceae archaeon]MDI3542195.1 exodeoxyribonuclease large subunit [Candidatus Methanomethylophilaceae archaeon]